jgi:predicted Fe-Mo cluster-binding NifX family protein
MKIAISSSGKDLDSQIDPRFGRCAYFLIVETEDMSFEVFDNENIALGGGAGIQSAQFVASKGAKAVITGNCGPNAVRTLSAAGVELFVGQAGTVKEVIEKYQRGELRSTTDANVADHYGMGREGPMADTQSQGVSGGPGMGRGMGMGMSGSEDSYQMGSGGVTREQELKALKEQSKELANQMQKIQDKIENLEKS